MKPVKILFAFVVFSTISATVIAQVSKDSLNTLKQQKEALQLSSKINSQKTQLAKLENQLEKKTREVETTTADAQKAAADNAEAAAKLNGDSQDKSLARKSENAGDAARKSAKRARAAADSLEDLKKDINSLKSKISDEEAKLAANPVIVPQQQ